MDFLELSKKRFSVLEYTDRPVEQDKIDKILEAGLSAPTACNNQPQRILTVNDDETRRRLNNAVPSRYAVPAAFLICYDRRACWVRPFDGKMSGEIDASIVATHMMLEATALGLGSIWVMYWDPEKIKKEFRLDDGIEPVALLVVGYKSENAKPRPGHTASKRKEDILLHLPAQDRKNES